MTSNLELLEMANKLNISNFRGVICRDEFINLMPSLPNECGIYNFNDTSKPGSHWAAWCRKEDSDNNIHCYHFCSYGSDPCKELKDYCDNKDIISHTYKIQGWDDTNCGEFCILFCYLMNNPNLKYEDIILFLVDSM